MSFGLGGNQTPLFPFHMHCLFVYLFVQFIRHFNFPNNSAQLFGKLLSSLLCILVLIDCFQLPLSVDSLFFVVQGDPSKEASIHASQAQLLGSWKILKLISCPFGFLEITFQFVLLVMTMYLDQVDSTLIKLIQPKTLKHGH